LIEAERKRLHFQNPPIIEAVISFTVAPLPESTLGRFEACAARMRSLGYIRAGTVSHHFFQVRVESGASSIGSSDDQLGVRFNSEDSLHAVQFNRNAFVFSRLGRYDRWERLRDEAKKLWLVYSGASGGPKLLTAGVRYINKLFIPNGKEPSEYVTAYPQLPSHIVPTISEMFMRIVSPIENPPGRFIHNQVLLPTEKEGFAAILFDNDFQFPLEGKTEAETWEMLEAVREIKDRYFVDLTTERMRETFNA